MKTIWITNTFMAMYGFAVVYSIISLMQGQELDAVKRTVLNNVGAWGVSCYVIFKNRAQDERLMRLGMYTVRSLREMRSIESSRQQIAEPPEYCSLEIENDGEIEHALVA